MAEYHISLPENVYGHLVAAAAAQGMTPADWIAAQLPGAVNQQASLEGLLSGLVGAINSQEELDHRYEKTLVGEAIAAKLAKQGIHRP